jgi:hypothetical protein
MSRRKRWYDDNTEQALEIRATWIRNNPDKYRASNISRHRTRMSTPQGVLEQRILGMIRSVVRYRVGDRSIPTEWTIVLGYTFEELKTHLESLFTEGMTWDKLMGGEIEIDHILPRSSFYYETIEDRDFKDCWALSNLQPMWRKDNRAKADLMPDGSRGVDHGRFKKAMLDEEYHVAGYELIKSSGEEVFG